VMMTFLIAFALLDIRNLDIGYYRPLIAFSFFGSLFGVPTVLLLFKFRRLLFERGLVDP
jgi:hypothetical protein